MVMITVMLSAFSASAQSFIVSDVQFGSDVSESRKERTLKDALGAQIDLQFFDNKVKVTIHDKDKEEVEIFDKVNSNRYEFTKRDSKAILELNTVIAYIRSFTLTGYEDGKLQLKITAKRK